MTRHGRWVSRMKQDGRCVQCGDYFEGSYVTCEKCRKKNGARNLARRLAGVTTHQRRVAQGRCPRCGEKRTTNDGYVTCPDCRQGMRIDSIGRRETDSREVKPIPNGPRCRCGLLKPCWSCVPPIYSFAASRRGETL